MKRGRMSKNEMMFGQITNEEYRNIRNQIVNPNNNEVFITREKQVLIVVKILDESTSRCVPAFSTYKKAKDFWKGNNDVERVDVQLEDTKEFQYFYVPFPKQTEKKEVKKRKTQEDFDNEMEKYLNEKTTNNNN